MASRRKQRFIVVAGTSVRLRPERGCRREVHFAAGDEVVEGTYPEHTPVAEWLATGHWRPAEEKT